MRAAKKSPRNWKKLLSPLASETRLCILQGLREEEQSAGALAKRLRLASYTLSHEIGILIEAGFVRARSAGRFRFFRLNPELVKRLGGDKVLDLGCCSFRLTQMRERSREKFPGKLND